MTARKYRSAMGKTVDIGALMLQNENVRAVGNMSVNARGDTLDSNNQVIDRKAHQIQRQNRKTNVMTEPMIKKQSNVQEEMNVDPTDTFADLPEEFRKDIVIPEPADNVLYSRVVPVPTTPSNEFPEPTEERPVPPLVEARVPDT